jgi:membrane-associated phospholipid phosphatase
VVQGNGIVVTDRHVVSWVDAHQVRWLHLLADFVTDVLSPPVDVIVVLVYAAFKRRVRRVSMVVVVVVMSASVIIFKAAVARPTPLHPSQFYGDYPSGHTAALLICAGAAILLTDLTAHRAKQLWVATAAATLIVAMSLIYISAHWLSDVAASVALSVIVLWGTAVTRRVSDPRSPS